MIGGAPRTAESSYVGRRVPGIDSVRLLAGRATFVADVERPRQLHCAVVRSDVAHGILRAVDTSAASASPHVVRVITAADVPEITVPVRLLPTPAGRATEQPVLARDRVRYVGEPVAIVVAEDPYAAEDAAQTVRVDVDKLDAVVDLGSALAPDAELVHPECRSNAIETVRMLHGEDVEALFASAAVRLRDSLQVQRHGSVPMETRGLVAERDPRSGRLTVWGPAKIKFQNLAILAQLLDVPTDQIRFVECSVGGGFGARGEFYPEDYLIPWLALQLDRPVKWIEDRRESLTAMNQSREQSWDIELAADMDGILLGFRASGSFNQGAYTRGFGSALLPKIMLNHIVGPYRWRGFEADATTVLSNKTPAGTFRGPCQYETTFVRERMLDRIAARLDIDPLELRARNLVRPADLPYTAGVPDYMTDDPVVFEDGDYPAVWDALREEVRYDELRAEAARRRAGGERVGIGVAAFVEIGAPGRFEQARVVPEANGRFTVRVGVASVGQGVATALAQIAAEELTVPIERIDVDHHDTDLVPEGGGASSSRGATFGGNAVLGAAAALRRAVAEACAARWGIAAEGVTLEDGHAIGPDADGQRVPIAELGLVGEFRYVPAPGAHVSMGGHLAVVRLEHGTCNPVVENLVVAYDVGRAINPLLLEGQLRGAAVQGLGGALLEEFHYDEQGQPQSTTFMDYRIPTAVEACDVDVVVLELGARNPLGAKGAGEGGIIGVGAAIANAVANALDDGIDAVTSLPIRPGALAEHRGSC